MRLALSLGPLLCLLCLAAPAAAAPALRYQIDQRGDLVLLGNTVGLDCRPASVKPEVGTIGDCGVVNASSRVHVLWSADAPMPGQALADRSVMPAQARSTAVLALPDGATVSYARLYWAAGRAMGEAPGTRVQLDFPGKPARTIAADPNPAVIPNDGPGLFYQSTADVTELVQDYGPGAYRVGGIEAIYPQGVTRLNFIAWTLVVFYRRQADPPRTLSLLDGLEIIDNRTQVMLTLKDFIPSQTGFDARLGVIAYQGDEDIAGDSIQVNGKVLQDALNPADNFLNGTRSRLGQPVASNGDLPRASGRAGSVHGLDLDVVDITALIQPQMTSATVVASATQDVYYWGGFAGAVATLKPVFTDTELTWVNLSNPGGAVRPGDRLEFTLTTRNTGSDTSAGTVAKVPLPVGLTYVPGSLRQSRGPGTGPKTDAAGDDQAEFDMAGRSIGARLGQGANATTGGTIAPGESVAVRWQVTVDMGTQDRDLRLQGTITAAGVVGQRQGLPPAQWGSGTMTFPNRPALVPVRQCQTHADCPLAMPRCDVSGAAPRCTNTCRTNADCMGVITGTACRMNQTCGCGQDSECLSQKCDPAAGTCVIPEIDLLLRVRLVPNPPVAMMPVIYVLQIENLGPGTAPPGTVVRYTAPEGGTITGVAPGPGWQCQQMERTVICTYAAPLPPGGAPEIRITVVPPEGAADLDLDVRASAPGAIDKDPSNNAVVTSVPLSPERIQLAGGGLGCQVGRSAGGTAALLCALSTLALLLWRRRRPADRR